ncbi:MAG: hypothetical protein L6Q98_18815 [Anaerolineae bacterium]|nr:hypothetical protein [Anaerolineae bacterium]NUQ03584.1 hypothetical protein [Anaerolineae bacterium]
MRRILLLIVPAALLLLLMLLNSTTADWRHPIFEAAPGEALYVATFSGGPEDDFNRDWDQFGGRLSSVIADGALVIRLDDLEAGTFSSAAPIFRDFDVTVQAKASAGPEDNGFGIVFRLQDRDNGSPADDSYYLFLISSDGYYQVSRVVQGVSAEISTWIDSPVIQTGIGAENTLRVHAQGTEFSFFINGEQMPLCLSNNPDGVSTYFAGECVDGSMVEVLRDDGIAYGRIGVGARSFMTDSGVVVAFDNLVVLSPGADGQPGQGT